ncbi:MAG: DNA/RNA non-specific endonuclease [Alphaproteobacteria bacterium]
MTQNLNFMPGKLIVALIVVIFLSASFVAHAQHCGCKGVSKADREAADKALFLSKADRSKAIKRHLPHGAPKFPRVRYKRDEHLLIHKDFIINYDDDLRMPRWVAYKLTKADVDADLVRKSCFRRDPRIKEDRKTAFCEDYEEPIYDRGHMAPNSDFERSLEAMLNTYMFTNMAPQYAGFNQGVWVELEKLVRKWTKKRGQIYIITGAIFDKDGDGKRDSDHLTNRMVSNDGLARVAIATHFYKILVEDKGDGKFDAISFILKHDEDRVSGNPARQELKDGLSAIDEIEAITQYNFFPTWEKAASQAIIQLESSKRSTLWSQ